MKSNIVKIEREGKNYILFNKRGMVLELSSSEFRLFKRYAHQKYFPDSNASFFNRLCYYEMCNFLNYTPIKVSMGYSQELLHHNSAKPVFKAPIVAHLGITSKCNMHCAYCSVRKPYNPMQELSTEEWKTIITKLSMLGVFQIGFTGGEPTLRKDIVELAKHVTKLNCTFNLTTNCWNLDEKLIYSLKNAGMRQCQVSLDSHIPKINDKLRSKGSFIRVKKVIHLLQKHNIVVGIDCVVSRNNLLCVKEFISWLHDNNVPYITLIKIKQGDLQLNFFKKLLPSYEEYSPVIEQLCSRENRAPNVTLDCGSVSNLEFALRDDELHKVPVAGCPAGHTLMSIAPNGDIFPCVALASPMFRLGNALTDNLDELWHKNVMLQELRMVKKKVTGKCKGCNRLDHCRGGCRGIAYSLYNNLWVSDKTCTR